MALYVSEDDNTHKEVKDEEKDNANEGRGSDDDDELDLRWPPNVLGASREVSENLADERYRTWRSSILYGWLNNVHVDMLGASPKPSAENPADELNKTRRSFYNLYSGNREETDPNARDRVNRGMSDSRGRRQRDMRRAQSLSSGIDYQGTNTREKETEKMKLESKNLHSESTSLEESLNLALATIIGRKKVQKAEMGKGEALVTMTDDVKGQSFILL